MSEDLKPEDQNDSVSVDELDEKIRANPKDLGLKEALASALVERYLYGDEKNDLGSEADIKRVRELLADLPKEKSYYPRAYVAYLDEEDKEAIRWLIKYAKGGNEQKPAESFTADELYLNIVAPFAAASKEFWSDLSVSLEGLWPESAAMLTVRGYLSQHENQPEQAIEHCRLALEKDPDFWPAALQCADLNYDSKNWELAYSYYCKALATTTAKTFPEFNFSAAWSAGKIGKDSEAERYYHACLDLHPEYPHARNNLGWSIYRQGRFEEALAVFDECIARKESGEYPKRNRAKTLARLGRLPEAMEAWKQTGRGEKLSKQAQEQITKLQARLNTGEGGTVSAQEDKDEGDEGAYQGKDNKREK